MARLLKKLRGFANDEDGARITDLLEAVWVPLPTKRIVSGSEYFVLSQDMSYRSRQSSTFERVTVQMD